MARKPRLKQSEFGGVGGPVQPEPHETTPSEQRFLMIATGQDPESDDLDQRAMPNESFQGEAPKRTKRYRKNPNKDGEWS